MNPLLKALEKKPVFRQAVRLSGPKHFNRVSRQGIGHSSKAQRSLAPVQAIQDILEQSPASLRLRAAENQVRHRARQAGTTCCAPWPVKALIVCVQ